MNAPAAKKPSAPITATLIPAFAPVLKPEDAAVVSDTTGEVDVEV